MNLPNKLTLARILLIPVFVACIVVPFGGNYFVAAAVFAIASLTDFLDGYLARKNNMVTDFGKFADPLADKILTTTALIYLVAMQLCSPIVLIIVIAREFAVSGLRMVAAGSGEGTVIAANIFGKIKTALQMVSVIAIFIMIGCVYQSWAPANMAVITFISSHVLMWLVGLVTLLSGAIYLWQNRSFINTAK
ncbi:MAG: CDP-diacylglycerol--glycerol-3-phosphate 3-phosphatidyltransferase [Oscillospiraceae bacterium]|nr:CDP-diacylglycerol--glycerol-3-phosphate 3-phosphatidyltransferase [Oscillospiraceae bacterium]